MVNVIIIAKAVCHQMVTLAFANETSSTRSSSADHVKEYAKETLSLGLLLLEFKDYRNHAIAHTDTQTDPQHT